MILTCPNCATRYEADAAKFAPPGRKVRCAKCGHVWHQDAPGFEMAEPEPAVVEPALPEPEPAPRRAAYVPPEPVAAPEPQVEATDRTPARWPARLGYGLGWAGLVAAILVIGWSALAYRQQVAAHWPRTASFYAALGRPVNALGLGFADVNHWQGTEDGQPVLTIAGKLVNEGARDVAVPPIEVTLTDAGKRALRHWDFAAGIATLHPGQIAPFLTRLSSPPSGARHLEIKFAGK
jgi:predicted Zn finger-like uncharacterized protein